MVNYQHTFGPLVASYSRPLVVLYKSGEIICAIDGVFPTLEQTIKGDAAGTIVANGRLASGVGSASKFFI